MSYGMIAMAAATLIGGIMSSSSASKNRKAAEKLAEEAKIERDKQQAILDKQKAEYKAMDFKNPFAGMENKFAENVYEDITVNQQQAQFQAEQGSQQRANIMENLKGAAGGSGIAGLAQALANQGALQTQRISASIGQQEAANQQLIAKGAYQVQQGESTVQTAQMQGAQWVQQAEMDRQATLLGMQMGQTTGANLAQQQAQANQMNAQIAQQQSQQDMVMAMGQMASNIDYTPSTSCFAEGDEVKMFNGTIKAIELIKVGDEVKSIKNNKVVKGIVTNSLIHSTNDVVEVVKINGITAEPKHPIYVNNKWILIGELETTTYQFIDNWYNLEIDGNTGDSEHNYIIGNLVASGSYPSRTESIVSAREKVIKNKIKQI